MADETTRTRLNMGGYWLRQVLIFPFVILLGWSIQKGANEFTLSTMLILAVIYCLWTLKKRASFDGTTLYLSRGWREEKIPLERVSYVLRTGMRTNRRRVWKILYNDPDNKEQTYYFLPRHFNYTPEFINAVRRVNPHLTADNPGFF